MDGNAIEHDFRENVSAQIRLHPEGLNRFRVFTPFLFEDGDHLVIVLKKDRGKWMFSDEAHTFMHLSGTRRKIISSALSMFEVEDRNGELVRHVPDERYGDALYSFIQALLKIACVEPWFADAD